MTCCFLQHCRFKQKLLALSFGDGDVQLNINHPLAKSTR